MLLPTLILILTLNQTLSKNPNTNHNRLSVRGQVRSPHFTTIRSRGLEITFCKSQLSTPSGIHYRNEVQQSVLQKCVNTVNTTEFKKQAYKYFSTSKLHAYCAPLNIFLQVHFMHMFLATPMSPTVLWSCWPLAWVHYSAQVSAVQL